MAGKPDIFMKLFIGEYLGDTSHLSTLEHGAYMLLLMHYYRTGPLRNEQRSLSNIARLAGQEWDLAWSALREFFTVGEDGLLHNKRADQEIHDATEKMRRASDKARAAANALHAQNALSMLQAEPKHAPSMPEACQSESESESEEKHVSRAKALSPRHVEDVYAAYPRKVGKHAALKAISKALKTLSRDGAHPDDAFALLLERTQAFARSPAAGGEFVPHPATWFNQGRYCDDPQEWEERGAHGTHQARSVSIESRGAAVGRVERSANAFREAARRSVEAAGG